MSWPLFRRVWVTLCNLAFLGMLGIGFVQDYEMSHFVGGTSPPKTFLEKFVPLTLVMLLVLGMVLESLDFMWPALAINVGFPAFLGFAVLGKYFWMVLTKSPPQYDPEAGLAISIVGIPFTVVAIADFLLYWTT